VVPFEFTAVDAEAVLLSGSVEIAPRLGKAETICDLVSTGGTLAANQLKEVAVILESEAVIAGPSKPFNDERQALAELLLRRLDGVLSVKAAKLLMLQAERAALAEQVARLDEIERSIHRVHNDQRYAMNGALIAIGCRNPALRAAALMRRMKSARNSRFLRRRPT